MKKTLILVGLALTLAACNGKLSQAPNALVPNTLVPNTSDALGLSAPGQAAPQAASPVNLTVGQTRQITIYVNGAPAQPGQLRWTTTNARVASVTQSGLVGGVGAGNATVRAALAANVGAYLDIPVVVTAASPSPTPTPTPTGASTFEQRVLTLTNQARASARTCGSASYGAAPALTWNSQLASAARAHAQDMAAHNYFAHDSLDGRTPWDRIRAAGYTGYSNLAENIAAGQSTPEAVVAGWLQSPGHCANIMKSALRELGVGFAQGGSYGYYWVQDFGARF